MGYLSLIYPYRNNLVICFHWDIPISYLEKIRPEPTRRTTLTHLLKPFIVMNLIFLVEAYVFTEVFGLILNQVRQLSTIMMLLMWNIMLFVCILLRNSQYKHLIFLSLFPIKLVVVAIAIIMSKSSLNMLDTFSWICFIILNFVTTEAFEVKTLIKNLDS